MGGQDKALMPFGASTLIEHVLARVNGQAGGPVLLNANGDPARFARFGLPVLADTVAEYPGPLAGVLAGMEWALAAGFADVVTVPTDSPFVPTDLVARLQAGRAEAFAEVACARSGGQVHPVCGLFPARLAPALREALVGENLRRMERWIARFRAVYVDFDAAPVDPFMNINTPDELAAAERLVMG
jgi:molybdopterin-guanine dinucleotide biosynthesis protein A